MSNSNNLLDKPNSRRFYEYYSQYPFGSRTAAFTFFKTGYNAYLCTDLVSGNYLIENTQPARGYYPKGMFINSMFTNNIPKKYVWFYTYVNRGFQSQAKDGPIFEYLLDTTSATISELQKKFEFDPPDLTPIERLVRYEAILIEDDECRPNLTWLDELSDYHQERVSSFTETVLEGLHTYSNVDSEILEWEEEDKPEFLKITFKRRRKKFDLKLCVDPSIRFLKMSLE